MQQFKKLLICSLSFLLVVGCVDNNYSVSDDVDLTMALGSEKLTLPLGSTEKIYLRDVLTLDKSNTLKIDETKNNLYYLSKDLSTSFTFQMPTVQVELKSVKLKPTTALFTSPIAITIPHGTKILDNQALRIEEALSFELKNIAKEVVSIKKVVPATADRKLRVTLELIGGNINNFNITTNNLKLILPSYIKCAEADDNGVINLNKLPLDITITSLDMPGEIGKSVEVVNGVRSFSVSDFVKVTGNVSLTTAQDIPLAHGATLNVGINIAPLKSIIGVASATGIFNPTITPNIQPIKIKEELPDFLKDGDMNFSILTPTLYLQTHFTDLATNSYLSGRITKYKNGKPELTVRFPETGTVTFDGSKVTTALFAPSTEPYTPQIMTNPRVYTISQLSSLLQNSPDEVRVDIGANEIGLQQNQPVTIIPNKTYQAQLNYGIFLPLQFDANTHIHYTDSLVGLNSELKDYAAEGIMLHALIENQLPVNITLDIQPYDTADKPIPTESNQTIIKAASEKETTLSIALKNRNDLKRLAKLVFRIVGNTSNAGGPLRSTQYIALKDIRLQLKGKVVVDFNNSSNNK